MSWHLELISRGSGLVADDIVEIFHIGPHTLECVCSEMLLDYLEVRGIGMLNIKTIFGETAVRRKKNLKLIIELKKFDTSSKLQRLPLDSSQENILGVEVRKITSTCCCRKKPSCFGRSCSKKLYTTFKRY